MNCRATTKEGSPCRAAARDNGLCHFHGNPDQAQKLGQLGGWKNRKRMPVDIHIADNPTMDDLGRITLQSIGYVASGDLEPRAATAMVNLIRLKIRIDQGVDFEYRLRLLEDQLAEKQARALNPPKEDKINQGKTIDSMPAGGLIEDGNPAEAMARAGESVTKAKVAGKEEHNMEKAKGGTYEP